MLEFRCQYKFAEFCKMLFSFYKQIVLFLCKAAIIAASSVTVISDIVTMTITKT